MFKYLLNVKEYKGPRSLILSPQKEQRMAVRNPRILIRSCTEETKNIHEHILLPPAYGETLSLPILQSPECGTLILA